VRSSARWEELAERHWLAAGAAAVALLAWTCRGALFGVPVGDDYHFLYSLAFQRPLDPFDAMGFAYYWRPLSRQAYYAALHPWLFAAPWAVAAAHGALLLLLYALVYRVARRVLPASLAIAAASFAILAEPMRALLVWPTGIQYLLPAVMVALAVHEALVGRRVTAGLAALAALLSHEATVVVLPALPLIAWGRRRPRRETLAWAAVAAAVASLWAVGRLVATTHGAHWVAVGDSDVVRLHVLLPGLVKVLWRGLLAQFNLEDAPRVPALICGLLYIGLAGVALWRFARDGAARARLAARAPWLVGSLAGFALGVAPLVLLWPDWNSWRTQIAAPWLGLALCGALATARPALAGLFCAARLAALLAIPAVSPIVAQELPATTSTVSFARLVRLQRLADSTRRALLEAHPTLPPGASVSYWWRIPMTEVGLAVPKAFRVWYGDSTITWDGLWDPTQRPTPGDVLLVFDSGVVDPAVVIRPATFERWREGMAAVQAGDLAHGDSLLDAALVAQASRPSIQFTLRILASRAAVAYTARDFAKAEALNERSRRELGPTGSFYAMAGLLALERGDSAAARAAVERCLASDPGNAYGLYAAQQLGLRPQGRAP